MPPAAGEHLHRMLFELADTYEYLSYGVYAEGYPDWRDPANLGEFNPLQRDDGWNVVQGAGRVTGRLFGGCLEVFDWTRGGPGWPDRESWVTGLLVGRARDHTNDEKVVLESAIGDVVAREFGRPGLPVVANLDFGHSDPQWVLPLGVQAELDIDARRLRLIEPWLDQGTSAAALSWRPPERE